MIFNDFDFIFFINVLLDKINEIIFLFKKEKKNKMNDKGINFIIFVYNFDLRLICE